MAYLTVTTQADIVDPGDGKLSLREAVARANATAGFDTIRFTAAVAGHTLVLTGGELKLTSSARIDGGTGAGTTIDADQASRVLSIGGNGTKVELVGLVVTHGHTGGQPGGGIALTGGAALTLSDCTVTANDTRNPDGDTGGDGAGIFAGPGSVLTIRRSTVSDNVAGGYYGGGNGGGVAAAGDDQVTVADSEISGNHGEYGGGMEIGGGSSATIERTTITRNAAKGFRYRGGGGGLHLTASTATLAASTVTRNSGYGSGGGGVFAEASTLGLTNTTVAGNTTGKHYGPVEGGGVKFSGSASFVGCTITGNLIPDTTGYDYGHGGGIAGAGRLTLANTIVAGNFARHDSAGIADDVAVAITLSNGHNVFGSTVPGSVPGDRDKVAPGTIFAALDPSGGGRLDAEGAAPLKDALTNPALSAADPPAATDLDQLGGARPRPAGSLPDIGAVELGQKLSTKPTPDNDVLAGTNAANTINGLAGSDLIRAQGGKDLVDGGDGSDFLDGGPGDDTIKGGTGVDLVTYAGNVPVTVDLGSKPATAKRGGETDTLAGIEGALGSDAADRFKGDAGNNEFQ